MSQLSLFGDEAVEHLTATPTVSTPKPQRTSVGACSDCGKLICRCGWGAPTSDKLARTSDPDTSKEAAQEVEVQLSGIYPVVWSVINMMIQPAPGEDVRKCPVEGDQTVEIELGDGAYTAREIAVVCRDEHPASSIETYRKRVAELADPKRFKAILEKTDIPQTCRVTGKNAMGFRINRNIKPNITSGGK